MTAKFSFPTTFAGGEGQATYNDGDQCKALCDGAIERRLQNVTRSPTASFPAIERKALPARGVQTPPRVVGLTTNGLNDCRALLRCFSICSRLFMRDLNDATEVAAKAAKKVFCRIHSSIPCRLAAK